MHDGGNEYIGLHLHKVLDFHFKYIVQCTTNGSQNLDQMFKCHITDYILIRTISKCHFYLFIFYVFEWTVEVKDVI